MLLSNKDTCHTFTACVCICAKSIYIAFAFCQTCHFFSQMLCNSVKVPCFYRISKGCGIGLQRRTFSGIASQYSTHGGVSVQHIMQCWSAQRQYVCCILFDIYCTCYYTHVCKVPQLSHQVLCSRSASTDTQSVQAE